jgi:hypothetical protein
MRAVCTLIVGVTAGVISLGNAAVEAQEKLSPGLAAVLVMPKNGQDATRLSTAL